MYCIKRSDGLLLCDGPVYTDKKLPQPIWQDLEGTRNLYLETNLKHIEARKKRLEKIYVRYKLEVYRLTEKEMEYLSFRKLRGY